MAECSTPQYWAFLIICCIQVTMVTSHECTVLVYFGLKTARCDRLNLQAIPEDLGRDIKVLSFAHNGLTQLTMDHFSDYPALQEIYIVKNHIDAIHRDAFRGLNNLQILDLEGNDITTIPSQAFLHLRTVRILIMKSNPITYIQANAFSNLPNIEEINFENCYLERIDGQAFANLNRLTEINLVNNELRTVTSELEHYLPEGLQVFRIYRNPWNCNCRLRWLRTWIANSKVNWNFAQNTPACAEPEIISSINWKHLKPEQFACPSQIQANSTTTVQLDMSQNVTVECIIFGDPTPRVTWLRGDKGVSTDFEKYTIRTVPDDVPYQMKSTLIIWHVTPADQGDYKCIADNPAGRSEVTYKLWMPKKELAPLNQDANVVVNKELILGIAVGGAVLILVLVICVVYGLRKKDRHRHAYKVREYKKNGKGKGSSCDSDDSEKAMNAASELLLMEKKEKEKEKEPMIKREAAAVNHVNDARMSNDFKMKLFNGQGEHQAQNDRNNLKAAKAAREAKENEPLCKDLPKTTVIDNDLREVTPDLLKNDHKSSPKQKPREENPYVIGGKPKVAPSSAATLPKETKCNGILVNKQPAEHISKGSSTLPHKEQKEQKERKPDKSAQKTRHGSKEDLLHRSSSGSRDSLTSPPKSSSSRESPARTPTSSGGSRDSKSGSRDPKQANQNSSKLPNSHTHTSSMNKAPGAKPGQSKDDTVVVKKPVKSCLKNSNNPYGTLPANMRHIQMPRDPPGKPAALAGVLSPQYDTLPVKGAAAKTPIIKAYPASPNRGSPSSSTSSRSSEPYHHAVPGKHPSSGSKGSRTLVIPPPPAPPGMRSPNRPPQDGRHPSGSHTLPRKPHRGNASIYDFPPGVSERSAKSPEVEVMPPPGTKTDYGTTV